MEQAGHGDDLADAADVLPRIGAQACPADRRRLAEVDNRQRIRRIATGEEFLEPARQRRVLRQRVELRYVEADEAKLNAVLAEQRTGRQLLAARQCLRDAVAFEAANAGIFLTVERLSARGQRSERRRAAGRRQQAAPP
jgi:hypothetical protein